MEYSIAYKFLRPPDALQWESGFFHPVQTIWYFFLLYIHLKSNTNYMLFFCSIKSHLSQHFHTKYVTDPVHSIVHSQCNGGETCRRLCWSSARACIYVAMCLSLAPVSFWVERCHTECEMAHWTSPLLPASLSPLFPSILFCPLLFHLPPPFSPLSTTILHQTCIIYPRSLPLSPTIPVRIIPWCEPSWIIYHSSSLGSYQRAKSHWIEVIPFSFDKQRIHQVMHKEKEYGKSLKITI